MQLRYEKTAMEGLSRFVHLDIFVGGRFLTTLHMKHCPVFRLEMEEVVRFVEQRRPSLRRKEYHVIWNEQESAI